jgi:hypothetical protein
MFETMQPPTRGAVVKRYGIELTILAQEGLSVEFGAMFALVDGWRFNEPTLRFLFGRVFEMRRRHDELTASFNTQQFQGGPIYFTPRAPFGIDDHGVLGAADEIAAHDLGATAYAGAVVLVLTGLLQACKADMKATSDEWNGSGPLIEGCSIGAVLAASANNFRHNDEWLKNRAHPTDPQLASIRVLAAAFREPIATDGANHALSRNVCPETLQLLSDGSFDVLSPSSRIRGFFGSAPVADQ